MEIRTYNYLNEKEISIEASTNLLNRVQENIEEPPITSSSSDCIVEVNESPKPLKIVKNKKFPFASTQANRTRPYEGVDLLRYDTLVRTIWRESSSRYRVDTYTKLDEKAVLRCVKNYYFETSTKASLLIQSVLIDPDNSGILVTGRCRSGKTTLAQELSLITGAKIVSGGNTLVSKQKDFLLGEYIPRPFYLRFSSISNCPQLMPILNDLDFCNAIQYLDEEALEKIIRSKAFDVDAGLCISRKRYSELLAIPTRPFAKIGSIVFTQYSPDLPKVEMCSVEEALRLLKQRVFPKKTNLFKLEETHQIIPQTNVNLEPSLIENVNLIKLSFAGRSSLTRDLLEDIIAMS